MNLIFQLSFFSNNILWDAKKKSSKPPWEKGSEKTPFKVKKQTLASETEDDEAERTLERLVFGGEGDVIKEIEKDTSEDRVAFSSNDEVKITSYLLWICAINVNCCMWLTQYHTH